MTDEITIKDVFRLVNTMRSETKEWQRTANGRFSALEQSITALRSDNLALSRALGNISDRLDGFETRLDRIEARLELSGVPAE